MSLTHWRLAVPGRAVITDQPRGSSAPNWFDGRLFSVFTGRKGDTRHTSPEIVSTSGERTIPGGLLELVWKKTWVCLCLSPFWAIGCEGTDAPLEPRRGVLLTAVDCFWLLLMGLYHFSDGHVWLLPTANDAARARHASFVRKGSRKQMEEENKQLEMQRQAAWHPEIPGFLPESTCPCPNEVTEPRPTASVAWGHCAALRCAAVGAGWYSSIRKAGRGNVVCMSGYCRSSGPSETRRSALSTQSAQRVQSLEFQPLELTTSSSLTQPESRYFLGRR